MSLLRFNPFGQPHKGLRALLYDTALLLQHTNFTLEEEIDAATERVKLVIALFAHHAEIEDGHVFPMIQEYAPQIVEDFEAQHQQDHALANELQRCLAHFTETNTTAENQVAGNALLQNFNAFLAFNVEHMRKEETIVNSCLWQYYSDEQLQKKVQEISAAMPREQSKPFLFWVLKGLATHEIIEWYEVIKHAAPSPAFAFFCNLAEEALSEAQWDKVKEALQEGALIA